jgi:hypothetical protein
MAQFTRTLDAAQSGTDYTVDLDNALSAMDTCHSGASAPTTDVAMGKMWIDTDNGDLHLYSGTSWNQFMTVNASNIDMDVSGDLAVTGTSGFTGVMTAGTINATNLNTTSDARTKKDVHTIVKAVDKVKSLRGVEFSYLGQDRRQIGVIAQETEAVIPEVVNTQANGVKTVAYGNIVGLLIESVKEQQATIEELKSRIEKLEK